MTFILLCSAPKWVRFFGLSSEFGPFAQIYPIFGLKFIKKVRFCPIFGSQSQLRLPQQPQSASEAGNVSWIRVHVGQYMCRVLLRVDCGSSFVNSVNSVFVD